MVATPADCSPLLRLHGAWRATAIAEHFRERGYQVLLLMDSLTRFAQAQREIGLAIGEPPATKGYPPSVFGRLPQLVELTPADAMMGGSGFGAGQQVEVTARIALGGQPTAVTGDPFGRLGYDVGRDGEKDLVIDRLTP